MGRASRQKGAVAEREVAAILQGWWRKIEPEALFVRTPSSGGWATPRAREAFRASGDVMTTSPRFPWAVEVKRREGWSERELRAGRRCPVWGWWSQACAQATELSLAPALWFRRSRGSWLVMTSLHALEHRGAVPREGAHPIQRLRPEYAWGEDWPVGCPSRSWWPVVYRAESLLALDPARLALAPPSALR